MRIERDITDLKKLMEMLETNQQQGYIFRGQPCASFKLHPSAFRDDGIKKLSNQYPVELLVQKSWHESSEVKKLVQLLLKRNFIDLRVQRLLKLTNYIMHYNHFLAVYASKNPEKVDSATLKMYELRQPHFWTVEETFLYIFHGQLHQATELTALNGDMLKIGTIEETLAGYDEFLPQHYDVPTAALDWTSDLYVAIYFALENIPEDAKYVAVYTYKTVHESQNNPMEIVCGHPESKNIRAERQKGCFSKTRRACVYFYNHGSWPAVENAYSATNGNFDLIKYIVPINYIDDLRRLLERKGINEDYLFPDKKNSEKTILETV